MSYDSLAGILAANQERGQDVQQAQGVMNLQAMLKKQKQDEAMRLAMAQSGGDVDKALEIAIKGGDLAAAHQLAPLVEIKRKKEEAQGMGQIDMTDPAALRRAAMVMKKPELITHAERIEKQREEAATLGQMKQGVSPDPQEVSQAADQGTPAPVQRAGIFADLSKSAIPHIAQQAQQMQAQLDRSGSTIPAAYWQKQHEGLASREGQYLQAKAVADTRKGDAAMPVIPPEHAGKTGDTFLNTLPVADRSIVKKLAGYEIDPKSLEQRGGQRSKYLALASQYNPDYDDTQYANKRRAIQQFGSGPLGNQTRNLNVAIEHTDTLLRAADALKNGDFTPANKVYNEFVTIFGKTPPNTFNAIKDIVANEVVKGTIGNTGALADRAEAAAKIKAASSPDQLKELVNGWRELMGGQVKGLERQYEGATGLKDYRKRYLTQRSQDAIGEAEAKAATPAPAATGGLQEGQKNTSKSGRPMIVRGGKWVYE